ncbi:hypothetical protein BO70DRAFT_64204 [Aspergillus heteromorphus CBS 117.55]|uniref:Uncharacterized protein n=1 Tax=Aspergillus heteromorphus CBS 117.55 TaxID=1448321 RepID=A0A317VSJ9_9EURO|nr:uncharacterized protein BO70DRAFT_64204 [Aspergillus heteromorphus CBS 117.55]PWY77354.1 hypothetical protein BO70DRAFT_64204 [Aspergillus heteromorphus CBS 117.55]
MAGGGLDESRRRANGIHPHQSQRGAAVDGYWIDGNRLMQTNFQQGTRGTRAIIILLSRTTVCRSAYNSKKDRPSFPRPQTAHREMLVSITTTPVTVVMTWPGDDYSKVKTLRPGISTTTRITDDGRRTSDGYASCCGILWNPVKLGCTLCNEHGHSGRGPGSSSLITRFQLDQEGRLFPRRFRIEGWILLRPLHERKQITCR